MSSSLLKTSEHLLPTGPGRPRQSDLRRAVSTAYYALFHELARTCADRLAGTRARKSEVWRQVYRALDHAGVPNAPGERVRRLDPAVQGFVAVWKLMRHARNEADYDPWKRLYKSEVEDNIATIRQAMHQFAKAPAAEQRALAILVLMKTRI